MNNLHGRKVTVMGLGHFGGGVAAARWAARQGASVTVTDLADRETLADALASMAGEPISHFHLGEHREKDFCTADILVVNPAVKPDNRFVQLALQSNVHLTSEIELFLESCPASVVGVTGSNGKSTTTAMIASILEADGRRVWLGGNLGGSLLERLDRIGSQDWVVLELSSFQLFRLGSRATNRLHVSVVTNCTPNHLNWHGSYGHYVQSKQQILSGQSIDGLAVLNTACPEVASWSPHIRGRQLPLIAASELPRLPVPGAHNRQNAALAATTTLAVDCRRESIEAGLMSFRPLPGRLELIGNLEGRYFYNDTTATTPESTIAALTTIAEPIWLMAGGTDKGGELGPLFEAIVRHARGVAFFGSARTMLSDRTRALCDRLPLATVETMDEAFDWCLQNSQSGESILLSPACASHDQFTNFLHRGQRFASLVQRLAARSDCRRRSSAVDS